MLLKHLFESSILPPRTAGIQYGRCCAAIAKEFFELCKSKNNPVEYFFAEIYLDTIAQHCGIINFNTVFQNKVKALPGGAVAVAKKLFKQHRIPMNEVTVSSEMFDVYSGAVTLSGYSEDLVRLLAEESNFDKFTDAAADSFSSLLNGSGINYEIHR